MFDEMNQFDMGQDPAEQPDDIMALIMRMKQQEAQKQALAQQPPPSVMEMLMRQKQQRDAEQAAQAQQALQQPTMMNQIYQRMAQENPERQVQLQQWQTQMPEDIAKANRDGYYGTGKFGRVIEAIAAATGTRPKFEQDALARYQRQQEQLKSEDVQNTKLAQAEIGATQRAQAAMMKQQTDERKRVDLAETNATKAILAEHKNFITEAKNRIDAINADKNRSFKEKQLAVVEAKNKMDAENQRLQRMASVFQGSGMGATVGRALTMASEMNAKEAEAVNKAMSPYLDLAGAEAASKAQGRTSTTSGVQYMQRQDGSVATLPKVSSTTRGGGDVTGIQRAIQNVRLAQGIGEPPVPGVAAEPGEQPASPQVAAPVPARPAPSPALAPYVDRKAQPYKGPGYALPEQGLRRLDTFTTSSGSEPESTVETWVKRKDGIAEAIPAPGLPGRKVDPKIAQAGREELANSQLGATKIIDAFANGTLDKNQSFFRRVASYVKPDMVNSLYRSELLSGPLTNEQKDFEIGLQQILAGQRAAYLQKISGAQVSEQEYQRLSRVYPMSTDSPKAFMQSALYHAMLKPALARLDATGVFEDSRNINKASDALSAVTRDLTNNIVSELERAQKLPPGARQEKVKNILATLTNTDSLVAEVLRKAFQPKDGWISVETPTHRIQVRVPHSIPVMDRINRKQSIGRQADEARQELRNKLKSSTSVGQDEED